MAAKCRAIVFNGDGTYEMRQFDKPTPPPGGAVIKVEAVGMCSSDIEQIKGHKHVPGEVAPVVAGHEMVGRVEALAKDAQFPVAVGDRVAVDLILRTGLYHEKLLLYGYTMGLDVEGGLWGGYGEYMCIAAGTNLMKVTESLPAEHVTVFEPLANAVNWVSTAGVRAGDTVVVQGPGHVGLMCIIAARMAGASCVIATGTSGDALRLEAARIAGPGAAAPCAVDITSRESVRRMIRFTVERFGGVDILINTAASFPSPDREGRIRDEQWASTLAVNVTANYLLADELVAAAGRHRLFSAWTFSRDLSKYRQTGARAQAFPPAPYQY